jgi:hypothetical protein
MGQGLQTSCSSVDNATTKNKFLAMVASVTTGTCGCMNHKIQESYACLMAGLRGRKFDWTRALSYIGWMLLVALIVVLSGSPHGKISAMEIMQKGSCIRGDVNLQPHRHTGSCEARDISSQ